MIRRVTCLSMFLLALCSLSCPVSGQPLVPNVVTISDTSGVAQTDRPVSIARPFRQGEIPSFAGVSLLDTPLLTQCDVKGRWPDGSLKFAVVSFIIPHLPAHGSVVIEFTSRTTTANTGFLGAEDMLGPDYDFDAAIDLTGETIQSVRALAILSSGNWRYWLKGPIVTAIVLDDRTPARSYDVDFGDGSKALHPIFEAWFYPGRRNVDLGYTLENTWASSNPSKGMRDLTYSLVLSAGHSSPRTLFRHPTFKHIGRSRWHRRYILGPYLGAIRIDHNVRYLVTTRAIPNYDTSGRIAESLIAAKYVEWRKAPQGIDGDARGVGNYDPDLSGAGARDWIGLFPTWDTLYLLTMDDRMREMSLGNADLAGRIPWHFREADPSAGTGGHFDRPLSGAVDPHGRVVSVNARRTVSLWDLSPRSDCGQRYERDRIRTGPISDDQWRTSRDHMPDTSYLAYLLTGRYYYLEELQYVAAFIVAHRTGCYSDVYAYHRQGDRGYLHDSQLRGDAWGFRSLAYAAFIVPDDTPEKAYFESKLLNNVAALEGEHDIPLSDPSRRTDWMWARSQRLDARGPSPLGIWQDQGPQFVQPPLHADGRVKTAGSGWEEHFLVVSLGIARGFGYPIDGLLRFMAKIRFNLLLNPSANPYLIEAYRWPHKLPPDGTWIQTYPSFTAQFVTPPAAWANDGTADHEYGFIALAALSYLYPYTVDGYSGRAAWAAYKNGKPGQQRFLTESPKWMIIPIGAP